MTSHTHGSEVSLVFAMVELDRLEAQRRDLDRSRSESIANSRRLAEQIRELGGMLRAARPVAIARQRHRELAVEQSACNRHRRLLLEVEVAHAERLAELERQNARRRSALDRLQREVVAEFNPMRAVLAWLTPLAAGALVVGVALLTIPDRGTQASEIVREPAASLAAVGEPSTEAEPTADPQVAELEVVADGHVVDGPVGGPIQQPAKKPVKKPIKPVLDPKPVHDPIVLHGGEDPLG